MLSYRHAFHAGNHADVLKHMVLVQLLDYLTRKPAQLCYVDTHAGIGQYRLHPNPPAGKAEWLNGIARLWEQDNLPEAVRAYIDGVKAVNPDGQLRHYPGSPQFAAQRLRDSDRLWLFELLGKDFASLCRHFAGDRRVRCTASDGFESLRGLLPPEPRRALVLMDPSYEVQTDYERVVNTLRVALKGFAIGRYAVWYPIVARGAARDLPAKLLKLKPARWLRAELRVRSPPAEGYGLYGSGMFIINPSWGLHAALGTALPFLAEILGLDEQAGYLLESASP